MRLDFEAPTNEKRARVALHCARGLSDLLGAAGDVGVERDPELTTPAIDTPRAVRSSHAASLRSENLSAPVGSCTVNG